jgi:integrase
MQLELHNVHPPAGLLQALAWLQESLECTVMTRQMHADHGRYLIAYFGDVPLNGIRYPQLREYVTDEKSRGRAKETIRKRLSTLKMALREGLAHEVIDRLPDFPLIKQERRPKEGFWTLTQWEAAHLANDDDEFRTWVACNWWFGLHTSDNNRLRWQDIDLAAATWVRRNTKNKVEPLKLPLPNRLLAILAERHALIQPHPRDLVCGHSMGHPNRALRELAERAGIPPVSPIEAGRHSCATYLTELAVTDPRITETFIMKWLGLLTAMPLKRHYRHLTGPMVDGGIAAINAT